MVQALEFLLSLCMTWTEFLASDVELAQLQSCRHLGMNQQMDLSLSLTQKSINKFVLKK